MNHVYQLRRGNASEWSLENPVLRSGEPGVELDTNKMKVGNGVHSWNDLPYLTGAADGGEDGLGWTGGSYDPETGVVTFESEDGLGFQTEDLRGAPGDPGPTGPPGKTEAGGSWQYSPNTPTPGHGQVSTDNASPASATKLYINQHGQNTGDTYAAMTRLLKAGALIACQSQANLGSWIQYRLLSDFTYAGEVMIADVEVIDSGSEPINNWVSVTLFFSQSTNPFFGMTATEMREAMKMFVVDVDDVTSTDPEAIFFVRT